MAAQRYGKRKKRNTAAIVLVSLLFILVAVVMVILGYLVKNGRTIREFMEGSAFVPNSSEEAASPESTQSGGKTGSEDQTPVSNAEIGSDTQPASEEPAEDVPEEERYYFEEGQLHRGDLILVNADYPFSFADNQVSDLVYIRGVKTVDYTLAKDDLMASRHAVSFLDIMIRDCTRAIGEESTGVTEAYRTYEYQEELYAEIEEEYGEEYAEEYVATPGYSEHHTGLAFDLGVYYGTYADSFTGSENAEWIDENAQYYGFVRRYKEEKTPVTGISNETWHYRYVGMPHSVVMELNDLCLEEYIERLRAYTQHNPLKVTLSSAQYEVFYTAEDWIRIPEGTFTVSGNNVDGYIVTVRTDLT